MSDSSGNNKSFTNNPLGFLGLLMFLFESILGTVFTIGLDKLSGIHERLPIVFFLIIFPILVLLIFSYIVIRYPGHLYGPSDYRDDNGFIKATSRETMNNINKEVNEIVNSTKAVIRNNKSSKVITKQVAQKLEAAQRIGIGAAEKHLDIILNQDMKFRSRSGQNVYIDGYGLKDGIPCLVEIKMIEAEAWRGQVERGIAQLRNEIALISMEMSKVRPMLVIVFLKKTNGIEEKIKDYVYDIAPFIECLVVDYSENQGL